MKIHVKPAKGLLIRCEKTKHPLPPEGKSVEQSTYWVRRIQCGDVELVGNAETEKAKGDLPEVKKTKEKTKGDE